MVEESEQTDYNLTQIFLLLSEVAESFKVSQALASYVVSWAGGVGEVGTFYDVSNVSGYPTAGMIYRAPEAVHGAQIEPRQHRCVSLFNHYSQQDLSVHLIASLPR